MASEEVRLVDAVRRGEVELVYDLVQHTTPWRVQDTEGRSLVEIAILGDQPQLLGLLLSEGCQCQDDNNHDERRPGQLPLNLAVELGRDDCTRVLLAYGACVDAPSRADGTNQTALHIAAMYATSQAIFDLLLKSSSHVDACDMCENTPLHIAAAYGSHEIAAKLLHAGADVNAVNASGSTPLHLASPNGFVQVAEALLNSGADVNAHDVLGNTPLIDAAFVPQSAANHFASGDAASQSSVIKLLMERGADVNARNRDGDPAISGAVRNGYTDAVLELLERGACTNSQNRRDENVLHVAARAGIQSVEIWERLIQAGADVLARDRYDRTCYSIWISRPKVVVEEMPEQESARNSVENEDGDFVASVLEQAMAR